MIPREILERIAPESPPELSEALDPREEESVAEDPLLRSIACWSAEFRRALGQFMLEGSRREALDEHPEILRELKRASAVGYGILDWHERREPSVPDEGRFPVAANYRLGIAIHRARSSLEMERAFPFWSYLTGRYGAYPVAVFNADFTETAHPRGGCSAAVLDVNGDHVLLTARHVVAKRKLGQRVRLTCPSCSLTWGYCHATVSAKGPGYIDAATLRIGDPSHICGPAHSLPSSTACPTNGLAIRNHFASTSGYVRATIMEGFEHPSSVLNPVRPRTVITSEPSVKGDSGSAVSTDPDSGNPALVGIHLGITDIEVAPGQVVRRGYALDADEALRVFDGTLVGGYFK